MLSKFLEANQGGIFSEALTADIQAVFPDQSVFVRAHSTLARSLSISSRMRVPHFLMSHLHRLANATHTEKQYQQSHHDNLRSESQLKIERNTTKHQLTCPIVSTITRVD